MYKMIKESNMKKGFKVMLYILLTITIIYWFFYVMYRLLEVLRFILHNMTESSHWWFFITLCVIFAIGTLILLQTTTNIKPFTALKNNIVNLFYIVKEWFENLFIR